MELSLASEQGETETEGGGAVCWDNRVSFCSQLVKGRGLVMIEREKRFDMLGRGTLQRTQPLHRVAERGSRCNIGCGCHMPLLLCQKAPWGRTVLGLSPI